MLLKEEGIGSSLPPLIAEKRHPASEETTSFPLSYAQQRLWFLDQVFPANSFYNIPLAVRVSGSFGLPLFKRSLEEAAAGG